MCIKKQEMIKFVLENKAKCITFRFFSVIAELKIDTKALMTYESIIPKGTNFATYAHRPDIKVNAQQLISEEWESIAYFTINDQVVCNRDAFGEPMVSGLGNFSLKTQENNFREIDITEGSAHSMMKGYAEYWREYKKENNLN